MRFSLGCGTGIGALSALDINPIGNIILSTSIGGDEMKYLRSVPAVTFALALLVGLGLVLQGSAGNWSPLGGGNACASEVQLMQYGSGSDYNSCQQDCRSRYGVDPYADVDLQFRGGRGGGYGTYYAYASCIQACDREHWKRFDREMDDVEKGQ
jgi:hypothetical protein